MERRSFVLRLKDGMKGEYTRRHDEIWPEMADMLYQAGIRNYSIWWYRNLLFGYYESESFDHADAYRAKSPVQARWNAYMADLIAYEKVDGKTVSPPEMVFYQA